MYMSNFLVNSTYTPSEKKRISFFKNIHAEMNKSIQKKARRC